MADSIAASQGAPAFTTGSRSARGALNQSTWRLAKAIASPRVAKVAPSAPAPWKSTPAGASPPSSAKGVSAPEVKRARSGPSVNSRPAASQDGPSSAGAGPSASAAWAKSRAVITEPPLGR